jgi:hypothetical protein
LPRLILLVAIGIAGYIIYQKIRAIPAGQRRSAYLKLGLGLLVVIVIIGLVSGRMHWIGAAATALLVGASRLLPMLIRLFPMLQWLHGQRSSAGSSKGQQSTVESSLLRMHLDHDSGDMNGDVLAGEFEGRQLDELDRSQLDSLLNWCQQQDEDSSRLLQAYLARRFGEDQQGTGPGPQTSSGTLNRAEALAILGLEDGASDDDISEAHRRLMQKLHPDRGGSDYLAAKLNQAKDYLLG